MEALRERVEGKARTGTVNLRSFDEGLVLTLGATEISDNYWLEIEGIDPPPGSPGIPVTWALPEDVFEKYKQPVVLCRRDDIAPALQRWHPGALQYRAPAEGATLAVVAGQQGFSHMEQLQQAVPFDFSYTVNIMARQRGALGLRNQANRILDYVLRKFPPYCALYLKDSIGDVRSYEAYMDGISMLDEAPGVTERMIGFAVLLRVEGELDLTDPDISPTVRKELTLVLERM